MRQLRTLLRLRLQADLSLRQIKNGLRLSLGAIQKVTSQARSLGLDWATVEALDEQQLARLFYPESGARVRGMLQRPDWVEVDRELRRKGVARHLLWEEYTQSFPNRSYSYPGIASCIRTGG